MSDEGAEPSRATLFRLSSGYRRTQALYVAAKLGIADRLAEEPRDAASLARELGVHPDRLFRLLRYLASLGVLTMDEERRFALTPVGEHLRSTVRGSLASFVVFQGEESYRAFGELIHTVKTGETAFDHLVGVGFFDYIAAHPEASATFHRTMAAGFEGEGDPLDAYDFTGRRVVVDVGGGRGGLLAAVLQRHPGLRGILFDVPNAVTDAREFLASRGVGDRCEIVAGSAFESIPAGGDVYVLSRVLHDYPDEKALELLRNCRNAVPRDGILLIREAVLDEGTPSEARAQVDLMMMVMNGGRERTEKDWRALLERARFDLRRVYPGRRPPDLIEAAPGAEPSG